MAKFRKKPVVIEAEQVSSIQMLNEQGLPFYGKAQYSCNVEGFKVFDALHNTWVRFEPGDWIIKGVKGEFYPCKADVFDATYEPA